MIIKLIIIVILLGLVWLVMRDLNMTIRQPRCRRASDYLGEAYDTDDRTETMFDRRAK